MGPGCTLGANALLLFSNDAPSSSTLGHPDSVSRFFCVWPELCSGADSSLGGYSTLSQDNLNLPWVLLGDFNIVRSISEKEGGDLSWNSAMDELNTCCSNADLDDLRFKGHWFTWSNKNLANPILRKLDRALINPRWTSCYPNAEAKFIQPGISDHSPVIVRLGLPYPQIRKPFRFFNFLTDHPSFATSVMTAWSEVVEGSPLF